MPNFIKMEYHRQLLLLPQDNLYDLDDRKITGIPQDLKRAVAEIALAFVLNDPFADDDTQYITSAKVDVLDVKWTENKRSSVIPRSVVHRLGVYGAYRYGGRRLGRLA
jgi:hypothetical protein